MNIEKLITEMKEKMLHRDLSDEYLREHNHPTREELGIGEYAYGITMIPCTWILPFLEDLKLSKEALKDKCEIADERNQLLVENQKLKKELDTIKSRIHLKVEKAKRKYNNTKSTLKKTMLELKIGTLKDVLYEEYYSNEKPHKYILENMVNKNKELIEENEFKSKVIDEILNKLNEDINYFSSEEASEFINIYENIKDKTELKGRELRKNCIKQYFIKKVENNERL